MKDDLHRLNKSSVLELVDPQYLEGLQSRLSPRCYAEAAYPLLNLSKATPSPPPSQPIPRVTPCTLWQDLNEVKASGLLSGMTTRQIRLQEVWKVYFTLLKSQTMIHIQEQSDLEPGEKLKFWFLFIFFKKGRWKYITRHNLPYHWIASFVQLQHTFMLNIFQRNI